MCVFLDESGADCVQDCPPMRVWVAASVNAATLEVLEICFIVEVFSTRCSGAVDLTSTVGVFVFDAAGRIFRLEPLIMEPLLMDHDCWSWG